MRVFSDKKEILDLVEVSNELCDIAAASGLLAWDQETGMPHKGAGVRAYQLATLAGIYHDKLVDRSVGQLIKKCEKLELNLYDLALVREVKREYEKSTKIPKKLVQEISEATSRAFDSWQQAKPQSNWNLFAGNLEKLLELKTTAAKLIKKEGQSIYDTMLDDHEEGLTEKDVEKAFQPVREKISALTRKLAFITSEHSGVLKKLNIDRDRLITTAKKIVTLMGYDWDAGRQDLAEHPFEISLGTGDVRMTTWKRGKDVAEMIMTAMHETGHALYEQGIDTDLERTHLGGGQGLVLHESQSRLWENMIGRSREFWRFYYPDLQKDIPELVNVTEDRFVKEINVVKPSLIRVQADEVTYGLHIIVRFEIEKELVAGNIKIKDLPEVWNRKYEELLGVRPSNDSEGVLQDVHWAHGSFGYFPTYLLGTMTSAQVWNTAQKEIDVFDLKALRAWLKQKIHRHGKVYNSKELIRSVTGEDLNSKYFVEYLENKFEKLYGTI